MVSMSMLEILSKTRLFEGFSFNDVRKLTELCQTVELSVGQSVFIEGTESTSFFIVLSGMIAIRKATKGGDEHDVSTLGVGSHFGEMAMLTWDGNPEKRSSGADAVEPSQVIEVPYVNFDAFLKEHPVLGLCFYRNVAVTLAGRIRKTTEDLAGLRTLRLRNT